MSGDIVIRNPWGRGKVSLKGRTLSMNEKSYLAQLVNRDGKTCQEVANTYELSKSVIVKYSKSARNGLILHTGAGQPPAIDIISSDAMVDFLSNNNRIQKSSTDFDNEFIKQQKETNSRRNKAPSQTKKATRHTIRNWERNHHVNEKNAEETTDAREVACLSIRNCVSAMAGFNSAAKRVKKN